MSGRNRVVRLPKEFRLQGNKESITRLGYSIALSTLKQSWKEAFEEIKHTGDFFADGREDSLPQDREKFE